MCVCVCVCEWMSVCIYIYCMYMYIYILYILCICYALECVTELSVCLHICLSCSRHHIYIWERRWSDNIHMATERASEHTSWSSGDGIQHSSEGSSAGASQQLLWVRWLSQTTHCKWTSSLFYIVFYWKHKKCILLCLKDPFIAVLMCTRE